MKLLLAEDEQAMSEALVDILQFHRLIRLEVQTEHLLVVADDTHLGCRGTARVDKAAGINAIVRKFFHQTLAVRVLAHKAGNAYLAAEHRQTVSDVGAAAQLFR